MKSFFKIISLLVCMNLQAQVGINYTPTITENAALIIKKSNVLPALRLETPQTIVKDQVLFSDDLGNISWRTYGLINVPAVSGIFGAGINLDIEMNSSTNTTNAYYTNAYIELPPGKWAVNLNFNLDIKLLQNATEKILETNQYAWARLVLSDTNTSNSGYNATATSDRVIPNLYLSSGMIQGPSGSSIIKGEIYVHNKTLVNKKYYLKISLQINRDSYTLNSNNKIRLKNFAKGPSYETNAADRFFAVYAGE